MNRQLFSLRVSMFDAPPSPFKLTVALSGSGVSQTTFFYSSG